MRGTLTTGHEGQAGETDTQTKLDYGYHRVERPVVRRLRADKTQKRKTEEEKGAFA